jgi:hypothetical protein
MTLAIKFAHQDLDAENERLMSHDHNEEKDQNSKTSFYTHRIRWTLTASSLATLLASTALLSMLLSGLGLHFLHLLSPGQPSGSSPVPGSYFGYCGDTSSSARLANCTFDIMSFSWLPPACADPELTAEFSAIQSWTWWLDTDRTAVVPFDEVVKGDHRMLFVTREYHMYHCTYMWRKLHRGLLEGRKNAEKRGVVDTYIGEYGHTAHCEMMLIGMEGGDVIDKNATDTAIRMKFPQCMWI